MSGIHTDGIITKAAIVNGNNLSFTDACEDDAAFIVKLRNDERKSRYISKTDSDIEKQREWLKKYSNDNTQAYFIIRNNEEKVGTVRIYDKKGNSFCWGSWIIKDGVSKTYAIESAIMVYRYALEIGLKSAHFTVTKGNTSVSKFHERFGAKIIKETNEEYFYELSNENILLSVKKYNKYLPDGIKIKF